MACRWGWADPLVSVHHWGFPPNWRASLFVCFRMNVLSVNHFYPPPSQIHGSSRLYGPSPHFYLLQLQTVFIPLLWILVGCFGNLSYVQPFVCQAFYLFCSHVYHVTIFAWDPFSTATHIFTFHFILWMHLCPIYRPLLAAQNQSSHGQRRWCHQDQGHSFLNKTKLSQ